MNQNTKDIAMMLNCDLETALNVQDAIDEDNLLDWSEASLAKINKVVRQVAKEMGL